tara:strand:- start:5998 stop:6870 length:873 start_codon:yes stop_codon:yes gene_type:complete
MEINTFITSIRMNKKVVRRIGWINGEWVSINDLTLPINDRGLTLADGIFETILIWEGQPQLLNAHLNRWEKAAELLGMASPPKQELIEGLIEEGINHAFLEKKHGALRLNWSRGTGDKRGIDINLNKPHPHSHRFWLELSSIDPSFTGISTLISKKEKRNANSQLNQCKTFAYNQSIQARREARLAGYDDALLQSTNGELSCGTTGNLIIKRDQEFLTPRLASGCLPGIMRQEGIACGLFKETKLDCKPQRNDQWLLINSLNCQPIIRVDETNLKSYLNPEQLWRSLYRI